MKNSNIDRNPWVMLLLCYFLGIFGVHKFIEKKVGIGLLYLFTGGICGVGWLVDCIRYLVTALSGLRTRSQANVLVSPASSYSSNTFSTAPTRHSVSFKSIALWVGIAFMTLMLWAAFSSGAVLAGLASIAIIALLLPIPAWQSLLGRFIKKKLKIAMAIVFSALFILGIGISNADQPATEEPNIAVSATTTQKTIATLHTTIRETTTSSVTVTASTTTITTSTAPTTVTTTVTTVTTATTVLTTTITTTSTTPAVITTTETPISDNVTTYVLNTNTMKFHHLHCREVKKVKDENRQDYSGTREDVINLNYIPCKICNP